MSFIASIRVLRIPWCRRISIMANLRIRIFNKCMSFLPTQSIRIHSIAYWMPRIRNRIRNCRGFPTLHLLSLIQCYMTVLCFFLSSLCSIVYVVCICRILNISKGFLMKFNAYKIECYHGFYFFVFYITAICIVYLHNSYFFAELSHEIWHLHDPRVYSRYSFGNLLIKYSILVHMFTLKTAGI